MRSTSSRRLAATAIAALLLAGCSEDARVYFTVFPEPARFGPEMVTLRFRDGDGVRTATGDDFAGHPDRVDTREYETSTRGTLEIEVEVVSDSEVVSSGSLDLPLQPDWLWNVSLILRAENPYETCIGCFGYRSCPLADEFRASPAESLWMIWGGNSISEPVVY